MIYLDSGILVKLYTYEPDSPHWRALLDGRDDLISSALLLTETRSAIRQKTQLGLLRPKIAQQVWQEFSAALKSEVIRTVALSAEVIDESIRLLDELPRGLSLRALDALHLATVRILRNPVLATTDARMRAAAAELKIPLL